MLFGTSEPHADVTRMACVSKIDGQQYFVAIGQSTSSCNFSEFVACLMNSSLYRVTMQLRNA